MKATMKAVIWFNSSWKRWRFLKHSNAAEVNDQLLVVKKVDAWLVQGKNVGLVVEINQIDYSNHSDVIRNKRKIAWMEKR